MMKLRGRELYIIVGVVAVVIGVMWYFFLYSPQQKKIAALNTQYLAQQSTLSQTNMQIAQLTLLQKTAPQAEADLIQLHQVMISVTPGQTAPGVPFSVEPIQLEFDGGYFDVEDFLYRLENYVDYRNGQFLVTGRMFSVVNLALTKSASSNYPDLDVKVTINGYRWSPAGASATVTGGQ